MNSASQFYVHVALWSQVVAAILFIVFLLWLWSKYLQPAIMAAQDRFNKQIAEAERHRDEAKALIETLRAQIEEAARDADLIKQRAAAQAARGYDAALAEAREAGERALRNAGGELDRARASARIQLREELASKALERARQDAARRVDAGVETRLVDRFITSLERG
jgi:F-type H+-transporting ATPase subunit b